MRIFRGKARPLRRRGGLIHEMEALARKARVIPLAAPVFLLAGFAMGEVTTGALALPDYEPVRVQERTHWFQLESLSGFLGRLRQEGAATQDFVTTYTEHVAPVERVLLGRGLPAERARKVAWPLVEQSHKRGLDPATVLAVMWIESRGKPDATSFVGASGLMQVMPMHRGRWTGCGRDLYGIEDNLCYGTSILAWYLRRFPGDERRALLGYNGCVRGTNTRDCFQYPNKVAAIREQMRSELAREGARLATQRAGVAPA
ncbi:MAG TPA: lytic transglycosylase domain-containing protein, partial [Longimicrobiales bacterium]|nr:lytic transglycosylase domain-containing protein [Longimicrobiales bacterium]